jgi:serine protease SohB
MFRSMSLAADLLRKLPLERFRNPRPQVAVLRLDGVISARGPRALSLQRFAAVLERAFSLRRLKAVALALNSPGGSPAQSALLYRRIRQLAEEKEVPVVAFAEDVATSGGYWLALAADEIFAEDTSLLGSIGVITASFGFADALRKLGVQRRLYTAGENKSLLDPFLAEDPKGIERLTALQRDLHESFKDLVRARRGPRLKAEESVLFSGEVFTGRRALELGLVDGLGDLRSVMRQRYGETVVLRLIEPERRRFSLFSRLGWPRGADLGDLAADLLARLEERLIWARFGL